MDPLTILKDLISFDSTSQKEDRCMTYIQDFLEARGFTVQQVPKYARCNLLAWKGNPKVVFAGHVDTTQPTEGWKTQPHKATQKGDKVYGLGAVDMKGSIAAMLSLADSAKDIAYLFTYDQEYKFEGTKTFIQLHKKFAFKPELFVFGDPTDLTIVNKHRGCIEIDVRCLGKTTHAGHRHEGVDASRGYLALAETQAFLEKSFPGSSMNIGYFCAGDTDRINSVPSHMHAIVDIRPSNVLYAKGYAYIEKLLVQKLRKQNLTLQSSTCTILSPPLNVDKKALTKVARAVKSSKLSTTFATLNGTSDAGFIFDLLKIPAINFGPGPQKMAHSVDEYVSIKSITTCATVYAQILQNYS